MILKLLFGIFSIVSDFSRFDEEIIYLKYVLEKNVFPTTLVDKFIKILLNKQQTQKTVWHTVSKKELFIVLSNLGISSLCLRTRLQISINNNISFCKIKIIFKLPTFWPLKMRYICVYALIKLFINLPVLDAVLPIMAKLAVILNLGLVNTQVSHL